MSNNRNATAVKNQHEKSGNFNSVIFVRVLDAAIVSISSSRFLILTKAQKRPMNKNSVSSVNYVRPNYT